MKKITGTKQLGFTLIESMLVIALLGTILILGVVNLFKPASTAKINGVSSDITSILREAQSKAINTDTQGEAASNEYGVHFETNKYILFKGGIYVPNNPNNFVIQTPQGITISPNLPANNIVFQQISGEVVSFDSAKNTVCLTETATNKTALLKVNFVGVVDVLQQSCI